MGALFEITPYMPHGYCLMWEPWLVALYAGSDLLIFAAYSVIPLALFRFLRKRPDFGYRGLVALFGSFILLCGLTHLASVVMLWEPAYPLHGLLKLATGLVSAVTAVVLLRLVPTIVALPSPAGLKAANDRLTGEILAHEATLDELLASRRDLEKKVEERTAELTESNERLALLTRETVHRSRNLLSVVQSIARQTQHGARDPAAFFESFSGRLEALAQATSAVISGPEAQWADLEALLSAQLAPQMESYPGRIQLGGPAQPLGADAAQQFALVAYELATNAMKHGALATRAGRVEASWRIVEDTDAAPLFEFRWREFGGADDRERAREDAGGFGTLLLMQAAPYQLRGKASREFAADGMTYVLTAPPSELT